MLVNYLPLPSLCSERPSLAGLPCCAAQQKGPMGVSVGKERLYSSSQCWSGRVRGFWVLLLKLVGNFTLSGHWKQSRNNLERKCLSLPSFTGKFSLAMKLQDLSLSESMNFASLAEQYFPKERWRTLPFSIPSPGLMIAHSFTVEPISWGMEVVSSGGVAMVEEYESLYTGGIHKPEYTSWENATMSCSGETE